MSTLIARGLIPSILVFVLFSFSACSRNDQSAEPSKTSATTVAEKTSAAQENTRAVEPVSTNLCTRFPAGELASLLGLKIDSAEPMTAYSSFESSSTNPGCIYYTNKNLGIVGVFAELISKTRFDGVKTDTTIFQPQVLDGVGDEAYAIYDQMNPSIVIRVYARKGEENLFLRINSGTTVDKAKEVANRLLTR